MSSLLILKRLRTTLLALVLGAAGCANNAGPGPDGSPDLSCANAGCGCSVDADCPGRRCDARAARCVDCLADRDCGDGKRCAAGACVTGCAPGHGCGDAGVCEADAGLCLECLSNADCAKARPECDPDRHQCVGCLIDHDHCAAGTWCGLKDHEAQCLPGCKSDADCAAPDAGTAPDGGVAAGAHCNPSHACVACLVDDDCPPGRICGADGACKDGCSDKHACAGNATCCTSQCVDLANDVDHCGACGTPCPGGFLCCGGTCANPVSEIGNCGACGKSCAVAHGTPACVARACAVGGCEAGWADCNNGYGDGCETHTDVNPNSCGACNNACALPHAEPLCVGGACSCANCLFPWADCNGDCKDGCETNTLTDARNCGACGKVCVGQNGPPACVNSVCQVSMCNPGFGDCNNDLRDGCETNLAITPAHCGGCGVGCSNNHIAFPTCTNSVCDGACDEGFADCNNNRRGDGCEVSIYTSVTNCGGCGFVCSSDNGAPSCMNGKCRIACSPGFGNCDGDASNGCEANLDTNAANCGACGAACSRNHDTPMCVGGACHVACDPGFRNCDNDPINGCEADLNGDANNCGACGNVCSGNHLSMRSCNGGLCGGVCALGFGDCNADPADGCEAPLVADAANCGRCGTVCPGAPNAAPTCALGACGFTCNPNFADCDGNAANGCEVDLRSSPSSCGGCGKTCPARANAVSTCALGACGFACLPNYADCNANPADGCETILSSDTANCGMCNVACPNAPNASGTCTAGACGLTCANNFANCDGNSGNGCEANLPSDPANCGSCGKVCPAGGGSIATCVQGVCGLTCAVGFKDCDGNPANGCERDVRSDASNCGACGTVCGGNLPQCTQGVCGNGSCNAAYVLDPAGGTFVGHMNGNSTTSGSCGGGGVDSYMSWIPNKTGRATVSSVTDYWPAVLYARLGACGGQEQACTYNGNQWPTVTISFQVQAGTKYYIIADHGSYQGGITLTHTITYSVQ